MICKRVLILSLHTLSLMEECPVCLMEMTSSSFVALSGCGHKICNECETSLRKPSSSRLYSVRCPMCRNEVERTVSPPRRVLSFLSANHLGNENRKYITAFEALSIPFISLMLLVQERIQTKKHIRFATRYEVEQSPGMFAREAHRESEIFVHPVLVDQFVNKKDYTFVSYYEDTVIPDGLKYGIIKARKQMGCLAFLVSDDQDQSQSQDQGCRGYLHFQQEGEQPRIRRFCPNHKNRRCCHHCFFCTTCYMPV